MSNHHTLVYKADIGALAALFGSLAGWLPTIALLLPIIWYSILIVEKIYDRFYRKRD